MLELENSSPGPDEIIELRALVRLERGSTLGTMLRVDEAIPVLESAMELAVACHGEGDSALTKFATVLRAARLAIDRAR